MNDPTRPARPKTRTPPGPRALRAAADDPWDDERPARVTRTPRAARGTAAAPPAPLTPAQKRERRAAEHAPHEIRIIGGQWRRRLLPVPDMPGLRPTPDRVRETLFNWLGQDLAGWSVLDAFAGTGALGFEAASRGATTVQMLERETRLVSGLAATKAKLDAAAVTITQADALAWMKRAPAQFDLVLLDPPFGADLFEPALLAAVRLLVPEGLVYLEADRAVEAAPGLVPWRSGRAGAVHYGLFQRQG